MQGGGGESVSYGGHGGEAEGMGRGFNKEGNLHLVTRLPSPHFLKVSKAQTITHSRRITTQTRTGF